MRRKIALVLAIAVLNCNINVLADTDNITNDTLEETAEISEKIESTIENKKEDNPAEEADSDVLGNDIIEKMQDRLLEEETEEQTDTLTEKNLEAYTEILDEKSYENKNETLNEEFKEELPEFLSTENSEISAESLSEENTEESEEISAEISSKENEEKSAEKSSENSEEFLDNKEELVESSREVSIDDSSEEYIEEPTETSAETLSKESLEESTEISEEELLKESIEKPTEISEEELSKESIEKPVEISEEDAGKETGELVSEQPEKELLHPSEELQSEGSVKVPINEEEIVEESTENLVELSRETSSESPFEESTESTETSSNDWEAEKPSKIIEIEQIEENTEEVLGEAIEETLENQAIAEDNSVYSVLFPTGTHAYLDPGNLSGKGQIFSNRYEVENYGNTDVAIKIKNIQIYREAREDSYEFMETEILDRSSKIKKLNIGMIWENENETNRKVLNVMEGSPDEYVIYLKAANYDKNGQFESLNKGSTGWFYFTGTMNSNPNIDWEDDKVTITFDYEIVNPDNMETDSRQIEDDINPEDIPSAVCEIGDTATGSNAKKVSDQDTLFQN